MGRRRLYNTQEEKQAANRFKSQKYYEKYILVQKNLHTH